MTKKLLLILGTAILVSACQTTPEPETESVVVDPEPIETCTPISKLEKVTVPAKTETFTTIVLIDNPPYEPIERREQQERVIEEAYVIYVDSEGKEVLDICEQELDAEGSDIESTEAETPAG